MAHLPATGLHLIADLEGGTGLGDLALIERALRAGAAAANAHVLGVHLHHFGAAQGVTGVALLAESHISIHTWPETGDTAVDLFICGHAADVEAGLAVIAQMLGAAIARQQTVARLGG
jgi:S-adenosylmethionine decarboxylase